MKILDRALAVVLAAAFVYVVTTSVFSRLDSSDTIAYGLPGANLVADGRLAVPQLGAQFGFDRYWLFNAPLTVLGCVPAFLAAGIGRIPFLAGVWALGVLNLLVFAFVGRRLTGRASWSVGVLVAFAFLWTRGLPMADLYNQKYAVCAFGLLLLAFAPLPKRGSIGTGRRWWQWFAAGALPLVHPVLAPASIVWVLSAGWEWYRHPPAVSGPDRTRSLAGPVALAAAAAMNVAWYGRMAALTAQLLPHVRYGGYRRSGSWSGLLDAAASPTAAVPTWTLGAVVLAAAIVVVIVALRGGLRHERVAPVLPAALTIVLMGVIDGWRGYLYYAYFLMGLGPVLLAAATTDRLRRAAVAVLLLIAAANLTVASRLDRAAADWTTTTETVRFVEELTRPTDRIVMAPPFVFTAVAATPARDVRRVVPQPYFLDEFDTGAWRRELEACCDVYIGDEQWFRQLVERQPPESPLFAAASIERHAFHGASLIVARRRSP